MRLYPVKFELFLGEEKIHKYDILKLRVEKNDSDHRKESYKVLKIIEKNSTEGGTDRSECERWIRRVGMDPSLEDLEKRYREDFTSLGIIKPERIEELVSERPVSEEDIQISKDIQMTLFNERVMVVDEIMNKFQYIFSCGVGCKHEIMCEDWELLEAYRRFWERYEDPTLVWEKLHDRFFRWLTERDVHFIMGTHSRFPTWMIIGLYYPQKEVPPKDRTLDEYR